MFLDDIYGEQKIIAAGIVPAEMILGAAGYRPMLRGVKPPGGVRIHIAGVDLIRDPDGTWRVLEDNLRTPSGVSYVVENRLSASACSRACSTPRACIASTIIRRGSPRRCARSRRRPRSDHPTAVCSRPGRSTRRTSSTASSPARWASSSSGRRSVRRRRPRLLRTTRGPRRVDVIYRRTDEAFLDPEVFRPDSVLGVPGLMRAYAAGNVALANAPGNGVADDKAVYPFVPDMIGYYLSEQPILEQVPTYVCMRDNDRDYVLEHLEDMVVKAVDEAGGYGMLMGPQSTAERARVSRPHRRRAAALHRTASRRAVELPDVDRRARRGRAATRRPAAVHPDLARGPVGVARRAHARRAATGSYVVNSSQGGGSKDTWVLKGGRV